MAQLTTPLLQGLSGSLGNLVFRTFNGKTFVYSPPRKTRRESPLQAYRRDRFRELSARAKMQLRDPEVKAHYGLEAKRLKLPNAYTALLKEMLNEKP